MPVKKILLKELGFLIISILLVILSYLIAGTFFEIWIHDYQLFITLTLSFYLIIGFYRMLNNLARKYRGKKDPEDQDVKKS